MRPYIAFEGCIGAGKTTLARAVANALGAETLLEDFETNPFLQLFYEDPATCAFETEMTFLMIHYHQLATATHNINSKKLLVSDFTIEKGLVFSSLTLDDEGCRVYSTAHCYLENNIPPPVLLIYVKAPLSVLYERIAKRGRSIEADIDLDYLVRLSLSMDVHFQQYNKGPKFALDSSQFDIVKTPALVDALVTFIRVYLANGTQIPVPQPVNLTFERRG
jgi:deoxyguanosine kinase